MAGDMLSLEDDNQPGEALLKPVIRAGRRIGEVPALAAIRERVARELERLPEPLRRLDPKTSYPVTIAEDLRCLAEETDRRLARREPAPS
jgi:nicotinate phosphoribosyltransferase